MEETPALRVDFYVRSEKDEIAFAFQGLAEKTPSEIADMLERTACAMRMMPDIPVSVLGKSESEFVQRYMKREEQRQEYPVVRLLEKQQDG